MKISLRASEYHTRDQAKLEHTNSLFIQKRWRFQLKEIDLSANFIHNIIRNFSPSFEYKRRRALHERSHVKAQKEAQFIVKTNIRLVAV